MKIEWDRDWAEVKLSGDRDKSGEAGPVRRSLNGPEPKGTGREMVGSEKEGLGKAGVCGCGAHKQT